MAHTIRLKWLPLALLFFLFSPTLVFADDEYDSLVIFGDSLSDPGNAFALTGNSLTPPYSTLDVLLIPDAPYAVGNGRFSNGRTWVERLSRSLEAKTSARPAYAFNRKGRKGNNFAVGGARARTAGSGFDLSDQVSFYLSQPLDEDSDEILYVIAIGGNDVRDALTAFSVDPTGASSSALLSDAVLSVSDNFNALYSAGARNFLIVNSPDISLTPAIRFLDAVNPGTGFVASLITTQYNTALNQLILQMESLLPDVTFTEVNLQMSLNIVVANPREFRLSNVTEACISPNLPPFSCNKPNRYLFWDGIHPTKAGHRIFARFALEALRDNYDDEDDENSDDCLIQGKKREECRQ